jgi:hypothetical protein
MKDNNLKVTIKTPGGHDMQEDEGHGINQPTIQPGYKNFSHEMRQQFTYPIHMQI